jgi:hypothetical protein
MQACADAIQSSKVDRRVNPVFLPQEERVGTRTLKEDAWGYPEGRQTGMMKR